MRGRTVSEVSSTVIVKIQKVDSEVRKMHSKECLDKPAWSVSTNYI